MSENFDIADPTERVRQALARADLEPGSPRPCSYLADRTARDLAFRAPRLITGVYQSLMELNFRRSGSILYRPACASCRQCRALRVLVSPFEPNRTQHRCHRRNQDLTVEIDAPTPTEEKHRLFRHYLRRRHDEAMSDDWDDFAGFLYESPVRTLEVSYRLADRLVAVGIFDVEPAAASTVYCYFDPDFSPRSLGVYNVLWTLDWCRNEDLAHLYLGYYIHDCAKMNYKIAYRPYEIIEPDDGRWHRVNRSPRKP